MTGLWKAVLLFPDAGRRGGFMIIILIVMTILAIAIFAMISGDNRKRKRQNPAPYVSPEGQKKSRAPGLD
jgi:hypothetical protein